jgi:DNA topoisomerase-1
VQHAKIRATLPKSVAQEELTLDEALGLLAEKAAKDEASGKTNTKKTTAKKASTKPTTAKAGAKKPVSKKSVKK